MLFLLSRAVSFRLLLCFVLLIRFRRFVAHDEERSSCNPQSQRGVKQPAITSAPVGARFPLFALFVSGKIASKQECSAPLRRRSSSTGVSHQTAGMMKTLSTGQNNDGNDDRGRKARSHRRGTVLTAYATNRRHRPNSEGYR